MDGALVVTYNGNSTSGDFDASANPAALGQLADYLQEFVAEDVGTAGQATLLARLSDSLQEAASRDRR